MGVGYASLVYETYRLTKAKMEEGTILLDRFDAGDGGAIRLVQMAEQLEGPEEMLRTTYSNSTWQNRTFGAAQRGRTGRPRPAHGLRVSLGLFGYPEQENATAT